MLLITIVVLVCGIGKESGKKNCGKGPDKGQNCINGFLGKVLGKKTRFYLLYRIVGIQPGGNAIALARN
jgi:hypothetical protein